jgi:hypothetical protein
MANKINVSELDFDTIKSNLKEFLRSQNEFSDYDFDGSGLSVLLDVLAYNTHYNAYYLNMLANESFLDSALLRNSVVSHAKRLGYTPRSTKAPVAKIDFTIETLNTTAGNLTLPAGYTFMSEIIDNKFYNFVTLDDVTVAKSNTKFIFEDLQIYEGILNSYNYTQSDASNPKQIFEIPDENIDTSTLKISVRESSSNTDSVVYAVNDDVLNVDANSEVYYLQEGKNGNYEIYFGDGILGKKIPDGGIVTMTYLTTNGPAANKANNFIATDIIESYNNFTVNSVSAAAGGSTRETVDQIKFAAPLQYTSQNRAVTKNDYIKLIQQKYPQFESVNVWGGEENDPPIYGKVFIAAKPREGFEVTDTQKEYIKEQILKPISILTVSPEIVDVDYNYVKINSTVYYDPTKTTTNLNTLRTQIRNKIISFCNTNLNQFNSYFKSSNLHTEIDNISKSVLSNELEIFVTKKFRPDLINSNSYVLDFGVELDRGTTEDNFYSSPEFVMLDEQGVQRKCFFEEVPSSYTGVESVRITNPGLNFSNTPIIEIVGDGQGATAEALIVNSRLESITVTNPGVGYTTATVRILGGGGQLAEAEAVLEGRYGQLRIVYFKPDEVTNQNTKVILNYGNNQGVMGRIDYLRGVFYINNFNPLSVENDFDEISLSIRPRSSVINSSRNKMLAFDAEDPTSIVIDLVRV